VASCEASSLRHRVLRWVAWTTIFGWQRGPGLQEVASLRTLTAHLQAENARLLRLLELTPQQATPPGPVQTGLFDVRPGPVDRRSPPEMKVDFLPLARLQPSPSGSPLLVVATGPFAGEGFDCPVLDTLFLAAPIAFKGRLVQYVGRVLRAHPGKTTAEVHDYHDIDTGVLASSLAKRAPGYTSLGFPDPRPSASRR
jgi:hypothetical protein